MLTYTPDMGASGTQRKTSKLQAFVGGCWRSAIVLPIIAVVCRAAGAMAAHPPAGMFPCRRFTFTVRPPASAGAQWVQLWLGAEAVDSATLFSVATPAR